MLYSLPSRELIADGVEYMVNAHCADALVRHSSQILPLKDSFLPFNHGFPGSLNTVPCSG